MAGLSHRSTGMFASRAADGDMSTNAVTLRQGTAWFQFSLDKPYSDITSVVVIGDKTMDGATLLLMSSTAGGQNFTCQRGLKSDFAGQLVKVDCSDAEGSFQHVVLEKAGVNSELLVSEVRVERQGEVLKHHATHGTRWLCVVNGGAYISCGLDRAANAGPALHIC